MITDNGHSVEDVVEEDTLTLAVQRLQELQAELCGQEKYLLSELANVREKRIAADKALATFTGAAPKKRRGRPRKQQQEVA